MKTTNIIIIFILLGVHGFEKGFRAFEKLLTLFKK